MASQFNTDLAIEDPTIEEIHRILQALAKHSENNVVQDIMTEAFSNED